MLMKFIILFTLAFTSLLTSANEVNLYSARKEKLIKPLLDEFTKKTNIKVNLLTAKADSLLKRLNAEGKNSPADLLITTDAGRLHRAKSLGVLQAVNSAILLKQVPKNLRDPDNYWFGLSLRARPIFYVKDKVNPNNLSSYEDLATKKWHKKICIRSSSNIYNQSLVASMIHHHGNKKTLSWAQQFTKNFAVPPRGGDRDQIKNAAAGMCQIAIANTYYFANMINGNNKQQQNSAAKMALFWPNQNDRGAHVNISGIGLTKAAKNKENAIKLMEFLLNDSSQQWYSQVNYEYPVRDNIALHPTLASWGKFKADTINLSKLGELNSQAVKIMDQAGWK